MSKNGASLFICRYLIKILLFPRRRTAYVKVILQICCNSQRQRTPLLCECRTVYGAEVWNLEWSDVKLTKFVGGFLRKF